MAEGNEVNRSKVLDLLGGVSGSLCIAELLRPWRRSCDASFNFPLLRIWDRYSGSQPDDYHRMNSRAPDQRLDTSDIRRITLTTHINHKTWTPTPYISFTSSRAAIEGLAEWRKAKRGAQTLTVINPSIRSRKGLPILDLAAEMLYYNVSNPYGERDKYCVDHYICLWQVTKEEIIGHWNWEELAKSGDWYQQIVLPAFHKSNQSSISVPVNCDISLLMNQLCLHGESKEEAGYFNRESDTSSMRHEYYSEDKFKSLENSCDEGFDYDEGDWNTDDEVEEANVNDDIIKMIEGDW